MLICFETLPFQNCSAVSIAKEASASIIEPAHPSASVLSSAVTHAAAADVGVQGEMASMGSGSVVEGEEAFPSPNAVEPSFRDTAFTQ
jgi:hypothetical protein